MASCNFHVGQKVVCVLGPDDAPEPWPSIGDVLTIDEIVINDDETAELFGDVFLFFVEFGSDLAFWHGAFRPVVERKTDISIFQAMLNKTPEQVPA